MKIITDENQFSGKAAVLALGMFDGVHMGHRSLIGRAVELADEIGAQSVICTFDRHPLSVICPEKAPEALMSLDERLRAFEQLGADWALVKPFTREFADMPAEEFLRKLTADTRARAIVCGENYTFGRLGKGNSQMICAMAQLLGYRPVIVKSVRDGEEVVSSTLIRSLLNRGEDKRARRLLRGEE